MNLSRFLVVFDFETNSLDTETCDIFQIGALAIDLRTLSIEPEGFNMFVRPDSLNDEYIRANQSILQWHANKRGCTVDDFVNTLSEGIKERFAWEAFIDFVDRYKLDNSMDSLSVPAGQNITGYDIPIAKRYAQKHKTRYPFDDYYKVDLRDVTNLWFMFSKSPPESRSLDELRKYFDISMTGAHDAYNDCLATAKILNTFLRLHKTITPNIDALNGYHLI